MQEKFPWGLSAALVSTKALSVAVFAFLAVTAVGGNSKLCAAVTTNQC